MKAPVYGFESGQEYGKGFGSSLESGRSVVVMVVNKTPSNRKGEKMKCDFCNIRNATFHYTHQEPLKTFTINLCSECAKKYGADEPREFSDMELLRLFELKNRKGSG